ncbi:MAG TPA: TetR/AcrR family transcriptional regulator C-terminal domain-containing protein [Phycisphaerae bacterium]|nr:TetR/AcrR family transcriptional regulator C-terminal domain-containing protein [Phycisphaerae bacterium]
MKYSAQNTKKKPGRPAPDDALTPDAVAEAALRLIDKVGEENFSMRHLGQELRVQAMALYNHFEDKDAILNAVAGLLLSKIKVPQGNGSWQSRVRDVAFNLRKMALQHPNLFRLAMTRPTHPRSALPLTEAFLSALADAGLTADEQATTYHACFLYTRGFCLWEIEELPHSRELQSRELADIADRYPRAAATRRLIVEPDPQQQFEAGLNMILAGVSATRPRPNKK